jgi:hypothetical protein
MISPSQLGGPNMEKHPTFSNKLGAAGRVIRRFTHQIVGLQVGVALCQSLRVRNHLLQLFLQDNLD